MRNKTKKKIFVLSKTACPAVSISEKCFSQSFLISFLYPGNCTKLYDKPFFIHENCRINIFYQPGLQKKNNGGSTPACRLYLANIKIEKRTGCLTGGDLHLRVTISTPEQNHQNTEHRRQIGNGRMRLPHSLV